ncbi:MAG: glycosyltransferase family 4 protein [bacterium]
MPRTRVLQLITRMIVGGAQEQVLATAEKLDPTRFEQQLWTGPQTGSEGSLLETARSRGVHLRIIPDLVREIDPWRDARVTLELARLMRAERFDLVNTHSSKAGIVGRVAARLAGVPAVVHTVHGWGFHEHMSGRTRATYILLERMLARWTHRLISVSERTTHIGLDARIGRREQYILIRSGVPLDRFGPDPAVRGRVRRDFGWAEDDVVVGSVGRLSAQKNPRDFVRLAQRILPEHGRARFLYVGDGPLRAETEAAVAAAGLRDRVILAGLRTDVPDLLRAMDVFVLTSLWEGLPRVVPQALATGLPVVAYDAAGLREVVAEGRGGFTVPVLDLESLGERVSALLRDDALRREAGRQAVSRLDAFSEETMLRQLGALYSELSASTRAPRDAATP